ncbi:MAG: hypothetical protein ACC657_00535 [Thiohalomonadales bacterium]
MLNLKITNKHLVLLSLITLPIYLLYTQSSHAAQLTPVTVEQQDQLAVDQAVKSPWFYGGGIAASFGDSKYFEISPLIGYKINPVTAVGVSILYRYRTDNRFNESYSANDYGTTLFARYYVTPAFFLEGEYEYIDYEYAIINNSKNLLGTERDTLSSILAGVGFQQSMSSNASIYFVALYNFSYDEQNEPYSEPYTIRFGVGVGF